MANFEKVKPTKGVYYRGTSKAWVDVMRTLGVGPMAEVLKWAKREDAFKNLHEDTAHFLLEKLRAVTARGAVVGALNADAATQLSHFDLDTVAWNHLAVNEHVFAEKDGGYGFQTPDAGTALESVSSCPRVAIKYAYGIKPDTQDISHPEFYDGSPNPGAAIAIIGQAAKLLELAAYVKVIGAEEAQRRIARDRESFLAAREQVVTVVDLPPFAVDDPVGSLDKAAKTLVDANYATA